MNLTLEVIPMKADRPSLKAFKNYMCNKYEVKNVDNIDMSIKEYSDLMDVFEAGYMAKEKEIIDRFQRQCEQEENDPDKLTDDVMNDWKEMEDVENDSSL